MCDQCLKKFEEAAQDLPPIQLTKERFPIHSAFWYEGFLRELFLLAKFQADRPIADFLIRKSFARLGFGDDFQVWLPVPPDPGRLIRRGMALPDRMAYHFSRLTGAPWSPEGGRPGTGAESKFMRRVQRLSQGDDERWIPLPGASVFSGKDVCLLDDLVATGETLLSFARFRRREGDRIVMAAALFASRFRLDGL
ncbi:MAG: ComF family protein [Leptospirales bacterium]